MDYNLLINEVYWGYHPFTNHYLTIDPNFLGHEMWKSEETWAVIISQRFVEHRDIECN